MKLPIFRKTRRNCCILATFDLKYENLIWTNPIRHVLAGALCQFPRVAKKVRSQEGVAETM